MKYLLFPLVVFLTWGCENHQSQEPLPTQDVSRTISVTVDTARLVNQSISINSTGLVRSTNTTKYSFKVGGVIQDVLVEEGDRVRKGQVLAKLRLDEIDAQVQQAKLALEKSERDLSRVTNLYRDSIATLEDFENTQTQVDVNQRTLDQITFNQEYATIYAQRNGYVSKKMANGGEVVSPGAPVVMTDDATSRAGYILECSINDREWAKVSVGDVSTVTLDAYPDLILNGKVRSKSPQANPVSGSFSAEIQLPPVSVELATGLYGKAEITTNDMLQSISIPYGALIQANGNKGFTYILSENGKLEKRAIEILEVTSDRLLISEGLQSGDVVVIGNNAFLSTRSNIEISK